MRYIATESELLPEIYECCISCTKIIIHTGEMPVFFVFINILKTDIARQSERIFAISEKKLKKMLAI